jgi:hypothetical protein
VYIVLYTHRFSSIAQENSQKMGEKKKKSMKPRGVPCYVQHFKAHSPHNAVTLSCPSFQQREK